MLEMNRRWLLLPFLAACGGEPRDLGPAQPVDDEGNPIVWSAESVSTDAELLTIWGRSRDEVWAGGWDGVIVHFNGRRWVEETTTATVPITGISGTPVPRDPPMDFIPGPIFAVGWGGTILQRRDDGVWVDAPRAVGTATVTDDLFDIHVHDDERALAVGDTGTIFVWDGVEWSHPRFRVPGAFSGELIEPRGALHSVWSPNGDNYSIVGSGGAAYRSDGVAASFEALDTRIAEPLRGVWGTGNNNVYAVGLDSTILRFRNGQWRRVREDGADDLPVTFLFGVDGRGGNNILAVGWRGVTARFNGRWVREVSQTAFDLRDVWVAPRVQVEPYPDELPDVTVNVDVAYAAGVAGTILRRQDPIPTLEELREAQP